MLTSPISRSYHHCPEKLKKRSNLLPPLCLRPLMIQDSFMLAMITMDSTPIFNFSSPSIILGISTYNSYRKTATEQGVVAIPSDSQNIASPSVLVMLISFPQKLMGITSKNYINLALQKSKIKSLFNHLNRPKYNKNHPSEQQVIKVSNQKIIPDQI